MKRMMRMYEEYYYENLLESYNKPHRDNFKYEKYDKNIERNDLTESQVVIIKKMKTNNQKDVILLKK